MEGPDAFQRTIGDQAGNNIERIEIVTMDRFQQIEDWCQIFGPDLMPKIYPIELDDPDSELALFDHRGLLGDIEDLFQEYGLLLSGGSIIIQETAALTAIDVNRGGDDRPIMDVNLEAAEEIARQIRLRNIGVIISDRGFPENHQKGRSDSIVEGLGEDFRYRSMHGTNPRLYGAGAGRNHP